jgi:hypothetical protein
VNPNSELCLLLHQQVPALAPAAWELVSKILSQGVPEPSFSTYSQPDLVCFLWRKGNHYLSGEMRADMVGWFYSGPGETWTRRVPPWALPGSVSRVLRHLKA